MPVDLESGLVLGEVYVKPFHGVKLVKYVLHSEVAFVSIFYFYPHKEIERAFRNRSAPLSDDEVLLG